MTNLASETSLSISPTYKGSTASGQTYALVPIQGYVKESADTLRSVVTQYGATLANANVGALAGLTGAADTLPYFTGAGALNTATLTALARTLLDDTTQGAMQSTLGLVKQTDVKDAVVGRLMGVGAFGYGIVSLPVASQADLDDWTFGVNGSTWRVTSPSDLPGGTYLLRINRSAGSPNVFQELVTMNITCSRYERMINTTTPSMPWNKVYHNGNILGTVSQSAGVPTGAIIERGSNANGEYVRFADGTQICERPGTAVTAVGIGSISWTYPAAFLGAPFPSISFSVGAGVDARNYVGAGRYSAQFTTSVVMETYTASAVGCRVIAIGRWY
ncbi:hypothetical protein D3C86_1407140 [compost metagenome]